MEKEKKIVYKAFLESTFKPIIYKAIVFHILIRIGQLKSTIKYDKISLTHEQRERIFQEFMMGEKARRHLLRCLVDFKNNKTDVIAEILQQYSMAHGGMATHDHDELTIIFDEQ